MENIDEKEKPMGKFFEPNAMKKKGFFLVRKKQHGSVTGQGIFLVVSVV
jgi:hypothetical protein